MCEHKHHENCDHDALYLKSSKKTRHARHTIKERNKAEHNKSCHSCNSRYMDVHNRKTQNLSDGQRDQVLGRYLSMRHKLGFQYFKEELNGLKKEKDDAALVMQD